VVRQLSAVQEIEEALVGHWSHFGRWPRGALVEEEGTLSYETPIAQLPYNGVIRTRMAGGPDSVIDSVLASFARRDVSRLWWHHPTADPPDLGERLTARGLRLVEEAIGMSLDLRDRPRQTAEPSGVRYLEVLDDELMHKYSELIFGYWEVPQSSQRAGRGGEPLLGTGAHRPCAMGLPRRGRRRYRQGASLIGRSGRRCRDLRG
jgi:hypothetical protein